MIEKFICSSFQPKLYHKITDIKFTLIVKI